MRTTEPLHCQTCATPLHAIEARIDPRALEHRFVALACGHDVAPALAREAWATGMRWDVPALTGASLAAAERTRQMVEEGYTPEHDAGHTDDRLPWAAWSYVDSAIHTPGDHADPPGMWPWGPDAWKSAASPTRRLVIAAALLLAEIDRRLTEQHRTAGGPVTQQQPEQPTEQDEQDEREGQQPTVREDKSWPPRGLEQK